MTHIPMTQSPASTSFDISGHTTELFFLFPEGKPVRNVLNGVYMMMGLQGEAVIEIDGKSYSLRKGVLLCLTPNHLLATFSRTDDFLCEYLFFEYDFLSDFPLLLQADVSDKMGTMPVIQLDAPALTMVTDYYDFILNRCNDNGSLPVIKGLLFSFITEINAIYAKQNVPMPLSRKKELADGFFRLLHKHYKMERTATFYAAQLCITDKYLSRVIKQVTGKTFYFWSSDFIIREAKLLLKSTEKSVTEISEELGFPNSSFFARFFRKHTGVSPMQFRR